MGTFWKSFTREVGKNTGKWASNKIFGNTGWATPRRHIIEVEERKKQRVEAREYKQRQKQIERDRKARIVGLKKMEKEHAKIEKKEQIRANEAEVREHNNYLEVIRSVHKSYSETMNWAKLQNQDGPEYIKTAEELSTEITDYTNIQIDEKIEEVKKKSKPSLAYLIIGGMYNEKNRWLFKLTGNKKVLVFIALLCMIGICYGLLESAFLIVISVIVFLTSSLFNIGAKDFKKKMSLKNNINNLENKRSNSIQENLNEQKQMHEQYLKDKKDYIKMMAIVNGVIDKDSQSYTYALNFFRPFKDLQEFGSDISFNVKSERVIVDFYVHSEEVIPNTTKKLLRRKSEVKEDQIPNSLFNQIYQDYVCSCILRIAKEIFQLLPSVNISQVNAKGSLTNSATGNSVEQTIASVIIDRSILDTLNFDLLDPSDSMSNFDHRMDFKKNKGFQPVEDL